MRDRIDPHRAPQPRETPWSRVACALRKLPHMNTKRSIRSKTMCVLALAVGLSAGCSAEEKKYCESILDNAKISGDQRSEMLDKCVAETKQAIEGCKNSDEIRKCYGNVTDGDATPCIRDCEMTEAALDAANKSSKCGDMADRCRAQCKDDFDCKMACTDAQSACEGSGD